MMVQHGYARTYSISIHPLSLPAYTLDRQCWEELKELKSDIRAIKDLNGRGGSNTVVYETLLIDNTTHKVGK